MPVRAAVSIFFSLFPGHTPRGLFFLVLTGAQEVLGGDTKILARTYERMRSEWVARINSLC